jgi:ABC-type glutathione transport system ATPase component
VTRGVVQAVDNVNFELDFNEAVVVIGESGCGKSSLAKAILRLLPRNVHQYSGKVLLNGQDTMKLDEEEYRKQVRWVKDVSGAAGCHECPQSSAARG